MVNYTGENEIFVISKKFEEIQGEIFRNQSAESPITLAKTNLAPEVCHFFNPRETKSAFQISTRTDEIIYKMISPERSDSTAVFIPDNKARFVTFEILLVIKPIFSTFTRCTPNFQSHLIGDHVT